MIKFVTNVELAINELVSLKCSFTHYFLFMLNLLL